PNETFVVNLSAASAGTIVDAQGTGTITNDDVAALPPDLTIVKSHVGDFTVGQVGATYTITVTNSGTGPTDGSTVTVADALPFGLSATGMAGTGWTCVVATVSCTRTDVLAAGASYPAITLTVNVSPAAPSFLTNVATVAGGGDANGGNNASSNATNITGGIVNAPVPVPTQGREWLLLMSLLMLGLAYAARRQRA
ncbi:MAG: hypothetical protein ABW002_18620, partial [Xanthomonas sp.]